MFYTTCAIAEMMVQQFSLLFNTMSIHKWYKVDTLQHIPSHDIQVGNDDNDYLIDPSHNNKLHTTD